MHTIDRFKTINAPSIERRSMRIAAMAAALIFAVSLLPVALHAQSTSAAIFGHAPAGETVTASSVTTGMHRHATVDKKGRYKLNSLPPGDYTVSLEKDTQTVDTQSNVTLLAGRNAEIDFACPHDQCEASANR